MVPAARAGALPPEAPAQAPTEALPQPAPPSAPAPAPAPYGDVESTMSMYTPDGAEHLGAPPPPDVTPGPRGSRRRDDVRRPPTGRRGPVAVAGVVAAVVTVIGTAAFAGGLFDQDDSADRVAPIPSLSAAPWPSGDTGTPSPEGDASGTPSASTSASKSPSAFASASKSPSGSASASASESASEAAEPAAPEPARPAPVRSTTQEPRPETPTADGTSLSLGDRGQPVTDLQHRLRELDLYSGPMHGRYDKGVESAVATYQARRGITGDSRGVYGSATRTSLESETSGR